MLCVCAEGKSDDPLIMIDVAVNRLLHPSRFLCVAESLINVNLCGQEKKLSLYLCISIKREKLRRTGDIEVFPP